jgi:HK97 family phage major capsid protein
MNHLRNLREKRQAVARDIRQLVDNTPAKTWADTHQRQYDRGMRELDDLDGNITALVSQSERSRARELIDTPFDKLIRQGVGALSEAERLQISNTMSTGTGSQGGFAVSSDISARFVDTLKTFSPVRQYAEVYVTEKGNVMPWPTSDGTAEVGELVAENATVASADPTFGTAPMSTYKYSSKIFAVPIELIADSGIDIEQFIFDRAAQRIGRITNTHFTTGTGTGQPQGFVGAAGAGKVGTTGQTLTVIHDDFVDLIHSVNAAYRQDPRGGVCFQMADATFKVARKLKDSSNRPIYLPSDGPSPESILGWPVVVNDDIPVPAANAKSIFFGNFRAGYKVRDALEFTLFRMTDSFYVKLGQIAFLAFVRCGGNLVDPAAVRYYQHSAT